MPSSDVFDPICYRARYPDLQKNWWIVNSQGKFGFGDSQQSALAYMGLAIGQFPLGFVDLYNFPKDLLAHWNKYGKAQNRVSGCDLPITVYDKAFNADAYLARYPDVRNMPSYAVNPYGHYTSIGYAQNRIPGYEILNENSPAGITAPLTTEFISIKTASTNQPAQTIETGQTEHPGDNTIYTPPPPATTAPATTPATGLSTNEIYLIAGGALLLIIILSKKKNTGNG